MENLEDTKNVMSDIPAKTAPSVANRDPYREPIEVGDFVRPLSTEKVPRKYHNNHEPEEPHDFVAETTPGLVKEEESTTAAEDIGFEILPEENPEKKDEVRSGSLASKPERAIDDKEVFEEEKTLTIAEQEQILIQQQARLRQLEAENLEFGVMPDELSKRVTEKPLSTPKTGPTIDVEEVIEKEPVSDNEEIRKEKPVSDNEDIPGEGARFVSEESLQKTIPIVGGIEYKPGGFVTGGSLEESSGKDLGAKEKSKVFEGIAKDFFGIETGKKAPFETQKLLETKDFDSLYETLLSIPEFKGVIGRFALRQLLTTIEGARAGIVPIGLLPEDPELRNHIVQLIAEESDEKIVQFKTLESKFSQENPQSDSEPSEGTDTLIKTAA